MFSIMQHHSDTLIPPVTGQPGNRSKVFMRDFTQKACNIFRLGSDQPCVSLSLIPVAHAYGCGNPETSSCIRAPIMWLVGGPPVSEACPGGKRGAQRQRRRFPPPWSRLQRRGPAGGSCFSTSHSQTTVQPWRGPAGECTGLLLYSGRAAEQGGATSLRGLTLTAQLAGMNQDIVCFH